MRRSMWTFSSASLLLLSVFVIIANAQLAKPVEEPTPQGAERAEDAAEAEADKLRQSDRDDLNREEAAPREELPASEEKKGGKASERQDRPRADRPERPDQPARTERTDRPSKQPARPDARDAAETPDAADRRDQTAQDRDRRQSQKRDANFGLKLSDADDRLTIRNVQENSLAGTAGLQQGDVILSVAGRQFDARADMQAYLSRQYGRRVPIRVERDGEEQVIFMDLTNVQPAGDHALAGELGDRQHDPQAMANAGGLGVRILDTPQGTRVIGVYRGSPAQESGIRPGDILTTVGEQEDIRADQVVDAITGHEPGDEVQLTVHRDGNPRELTATLVTRREALAGQPNLERGWQAGIAQQRLGAPMTRDGEFFGPPAFADRGFPQDRRTVMRPPLDRSGQAGDRQVQQMQQQIDQLRHQVQQLQQQVNRLTNGQEGEKPTGGAIIDERPEDAFDEVQEGEAPQQPANDRRPDADRPTTPPAP